MRIKPNPLHSEEYVLSALRSPEGYETDMHTGRTTAIAFETIAKAIRSPRTKIGISDHFGTYEATKFLANIIKDIIAQTELKHMYVVVQNNTHTGSISYLQFGKD